LAQTVTASTNEKLCKIYKFACATICNCVEICW